MQSEGVQRTAEHDRLPEMLLALLILIVSPLAAIAGDVDFTYLGLAVLLIVFPSIYIMTVMKVNEEPDLAEKRRLFKIYLAFFVILLLIIVGYELYRTNWPSSLGSVIGRMATRIYLVFAAIQSICLVVVNLFLKRHAADPNDKRLRLRLWMSVLMVLVSPLNLLLYVALFFQGT